MGDTGSRQTKLPKEAARTIAESEDRFRALADNVSDAIVELDAEGRFVFVGRNCETVFGVPAEELSGQFLTTNVISPRVRASDEDGEGAILESLRGGKFDVNIRPEWKYEHPDGQTRWLESHVAFYRTAAGEHRSVIVTRDVTARVEVERQLRQSEERYRVVAQLTKDLITEQDVDGRLSYISPNCEALIGYRPEELVGKNPFAILCAPDEVEVVHGYFLDSVATTEPRFFGAYHIRHKDGTLRRYEGGAVTYRKADGSVSVVGINRDITERVEAALEHSRLEDQMQQAQKLESLGVMAGGIAHDFNNLLTPILGEAGLALADLPPDSPVRERLRKIQMAANRAASLTNQMLAYAGKGPVIVEAVEPARLVHEMGNLLESALRGKAAIEYEVDYGAPPIRGDASQLSQLVMNLITNASEAIEHTSGRIVVRTGRQQIDETVGVDVQLGGPIAPGEYVFIEVEDNGSGMDSQTRRRIFEPFYTSKFTGRGLGLAAALGIVRGHGGSLQIDSEPGRGTRFRVLFPAARALPALRKDRFDDEAESLAWRANATVLIVDDDEGARALSEETLKRCGLEVLTACGGQEALEIFREHGDRIALVILDRTMPGLSGEAVFDALRRDRADVRVLLLSGYSEESSVQSFEGRGLAGFVQKPFFPAALIDAVRDALEPAART